MVKNNDTQQAGRIQTNQGNIEYVYHKGAGIPVFFIHGTPGDYSQVYFYLKEMIESGYPVVSISRPGYGSTSSTSISKCFMQQAKVIESVIDHLGIPKVVLYAVSGGSAISYRFVDLYPERCMGMILESPVVGSWKQNKGGPIDFLVSSMYVNDRISSLGKVTLNWFPKLFIALCLMHFGNYTVKEVYRVVSRMLLDRSSVIGKFSILLDTTVPRRHKQGYLNDLSELKDDVNYPKHTDLPILIINGELDRETPIELARIFFSRLKESSLYEVKSGHHLLPLIPDRRCVDKEAMKFLGSISKRNSSSCKL